MNKVTRVHHRMATPAYCQTRLLQSVCMNDLSRLGPIEHAIQTKDAVALLAVIRNRSEFDPGNGCHLWRGSKRVNGYAYSGRHQTNRLVHRLVYWAAQMDLRGEYHEVPKPLHHRCGVAACVNPEHISLTSQAANAVESLARNFHVKLIADLASALTVHEPDHPLISVAEAAQVTLPALPGTYSQSSSASSRFLARRAVANAQYAANRKAHEVSRFEQVLEVDRLRNRGTTLKKALEKVRISRSVYQDWTIRLRQAMQR
ncbi:hypothetical protein [Arthrobacter sp. VKM Ac-2550]|uniref:hypothetical protein n=1 Tax=Crystallibacter permensis TaxID=1938888 RepID=UPI00222626D7|nr:hypothetical protein [Arthrobacter sp. VKM Ac-2550]MCW2131722.1 hypothetical protein [Arthrobacter sp. VKM Ac-2550]